MTLDKITLPPRGDLRTHWFSHQDEPIGRLLEIQQWIGDNIPLAEHWNTGYHWVISEQWALIFALRWL